MAIDQLILQAATGARSLTADELQQTLADVAQAGFDPNALERARGRLAGVHWRGRVLTGRDMLSPAEAHYLRHVVVGQEWPTGTRLTAFLGSIRDVIVDQDSGVLTCRYSGEVQLTIIRPSGSLQGPGGFPWVLVDYRLTTGY